MIIALAGYKTQNIGEIPEILYVGDNGVKLLDVAGQQGGKGFVRLRRFQLDSGIPIALPVAKPAEKADDKQSATEGDDQAKKDAEKAAKKAEAKAKKDAEKAAKNKTE